MHFKFRLLLKVIVVDSRKKFIVLRMPFSSCLLIDFKGNIESPERVLLCLCWWVSPGCPLNIGFCCTFHGHVLKEYFCGASRGWAAVCCPCRAIPCSLRLVCFLGWLEAIVFRRVVDFSEFCFNLFWLSI